MTAICKDNRGLQFLVVGEEYKVVDSYIDRYEGYKVLVIELESGDHRAYKADRFLIKDGEVGL